MNHKDWMKKYYPISAGDVKGTDLDLIDHCINKWEGLKDTEPYGVRLYRGILVDSDFGIILEINGESCALCYKYYDDNPYGYEPHACTDCPLERSIGRPCDEDEDNDDGVFYRSLKNPQVMIDALKAAREMVEKELSNESGD